MFAVFAPPDIIEIISRVFETLFTTQEIEPATLDQYYGTGAGFPGGAAGCRLPLAAVFGVPDIIEELSIKGAEVVIACQLTPSVLRRTSLKKSDAVMKSGQGPNCGGHSEHGNGLGMAMKFWPPIMYMWLAFVTASK